MVIQQKEAEIKAIKEGSKDDSLSSYAESQ
jgi:hypothetical protein